MKKRSIVAKFGGTSLADAGQFRKIKAILEESPERRIVVVSAPGKRFPEDTKVTDMLYQCYDKASEGKEIHEDISRIASRCVLK